MALLVDDARRLVLGSIASATTDAERLELLRQLEDLKSLVAAAQAEITVAFDRSVRNRREAEGVPAERRGRGIAAEIALARRESPQRGAHLMVLARALVEELPHTLAALRSGVLSEFRASLVATETVCLSRDDRAAADAELSADPARLEGLGNARLTGAVRAIAYRRDPASFVARSARARADRRVGLRPAPDTMARLGALLPVEHGVAVHAALGRLADAANARGDGRSRAQVMADALVERISGLDLGVGEPTDASEPVGVQVDLVVSDETLLGGAPDPGWILGYGPVPAQLARDLVARAERQARASLRRLYASPATGTLVAMDSRSRTFPAGLAHLIACRDLTCRTPWCDAPIRQSDHVEPWAAGGPTRAANGQGLCVQCNLAKQASDWTSRVSDPRTITVRSPHGVRAASRSPDLPRPRSRSTPAVVVEIYRAAPELHIDWAS